MSAMPIYTTVSGSRTTGPQRVVSSWTAPQSVPTTTVRTVASSQSYAVPAAAPRISYVQAQGGGYTAPPYAFQQTHQVQAQQVIRQAPATVHHVLPTSASQGSTRVVHVAPARHVQTQAASNGQAGQPGQQRPHNLAGPAYSEQAYQAKHHDDPQLQNLKELRKTSGLKHVPVDQGLQMLKAAAVDGKLSREQFQEAYLRILQDHNVEVPSEEVRNAVFDLFDRDDNNVVDMMELICGISLLCAGAEDDKISAVFNVFDENGDGYISMDEMFKFLTSVFKVVLTPNVISVMNSMGVLVESAEDLASVTSLECFKTADLNHDGKLSVSEFKTWFNAPRNDPSFLFSPVRKLLQ